MSSVAVIITTAEGREPYVLECLQSLFNSDLADTRLDVIVIDNGSTERLAGVVASYGERVRLIRNEGNFPLAETYNQGMALVREELHAAYVLLLNDDTRLAPDCLQRLLDASVQYPDAVLTPMQLTYQPPHGIDEGIYSLVNEQRDLVEDAVMRRPLKEVYPLPTLVGAAIFAHEGLYERIGPFDETFPFYGVDDDYCVRARHLGYEVLLVPGARLSHLHGRFASTQEEDFESWWWRWKSMLFGRNLLLLKRPEKPLWMNCLALTGRTAMSCGYSLSHLQLRGFVAFLISYGRMLRRLLRIRACRRAHYDPSRRNERNRATPA
ncbi:MAG: glycosyltransferase family 2 protein [Candidatus Hydrogenedentes bacterium]|nr:glycosyltransferase family 2 protein [Candidatus Hydrogenedentota bacterium]